MARSALKFCILNARLRFEKYYGIFREGLLAKWYRDDATSGIRAIVHRPGFL